MTGIIQRITSSLLIFSSPTPNPFFCIGHTLSLNCFSIGYIYQSCPLPLILSMYFQRTRILSNSRVRKFSIEIIPMFQFCQLTLKKKLSFIAFYSRPGPQITFSCHVSLVLNDLSAFFVSHSTDILEQYRAALF